MPTDDDADKLVCKCCGEATRRYDSFCSTCQHPWDSYCDRHEEYKARIEFEKEMYGGSLGDLEKELYGTQAL